MLDIFALSAAIMASQPQIEPEPLSADEIQNVRAACELPDTAKFIDARDMASADELATYLEAFDHPISIVHGAKFAGDDVAVLLGKLAGGCIHDSDLSNTSASRAEFENSAIVRSSIEGANWQGAQLDGTRFVGVNAKNAQLNGATMRGGIWSGRYWKSNLLDADFSGAMMDGFRFECGITMDESCGATGRANFSGADLRNADLADQSFIAYWDLDGASIEAARVNPRSLRWLEEASIEAEVTLAASSARFAGPSDRLNGDEFAALRDETILLKTDKPTFDCAQAQGFVEENICWEFAHHLRRFDRQLAEIYSEALRKRVRGVRRDQRRWLKQRNACETTRCIATAYQDRISDILAEIGSPIVLAPDATLHFTTDVLPVTSATRGGELYKRLLPVLRASSRQDVTLTGLEDGGIRIQGEAVGANAHLCSWNAQTHYDAETGWYVARGENGDPVQMFRVWKGKLEPRYSGNIGDTPDAAADFISCGARASFGDLRNLEATD